MGPDTGTQGRNRKARVAHLPQPAHPHAAVEVAVAAAALDLPPLYPNWTEQDIAEELLTPETFQWWKTREALAARGLLPDIPQIYPSGTQKQQTVPTFATDKENLEWEDLSLGVRWIILLRLSEQHSFAAVVVSQLKLSQHQVHEFVTSYINFCDQWNAFENTVVQRSMALGGYAEQRDRLLINWLHEKRPQLPYDRITDEHVQMGLRFLRERGIVDHNVDLQEWADEKDTKDFAHIRIEIPLMRDCMDHRLLRRAAAAKLLSVREIEEAIRQHGRDNRRNEYKAHIGNSMTNDAFLGALQAVVPWEGDLLYDDDAELSPEAQAILATISTDLRIGEPMPMPIPPYQRHQKAEEATRSLRRMVPELQPQCAPGGLARTQWEIDHGYPCGYVSSLQDHLSALVSITAQFSD